MKHILKYNTNFPPRNHQHSNFGLRKHCCGNCWGNIRISDCNNIIIVRWSRGNLCGDGRILPIFQSSPYKCYSHSIFNNGIYLHYEYQKILKMISKLPDIFYKCSFNYDLKYVVSVNVKIFCDISLVFFCTRRHDLYTRSKKLRDLYIYISHYPCHMREYDIS